MAIFPTLCLCYIKETTEPTTTGSKTMRMIWAIFQDNKLVKRYWTQQEAESERDFGQHIREWREGNYYNENGKRVSGVWVKV